MLWVLCRLIFSSMGVLCADDAECGQIDNLLLPAPTHDPTAAKWLADNSDFLSDKMCLGDGKKLPVGSAECGICREAIEAGDSYATFVREQRVYAHRSCMSCDACGMSFGKPTAAEELRRSQAADASGWRDEADSGSGGGDETVENGFEKWIGSRYLCGDCWDRRCFCCLLGGRSAVNAESFCGDCLKRERKASLKKIIGEYNEARWFLKHMAKVNLSGFSKPKRVCKHQRGIYHRLKYQPQAGRPKRRQVWKYSTAHVLYNPLRMLFNSLEILRNKRGLVSPHVWQLHHTWVILGMAYMEYKIRKMLKTKRSSNPLGKKRSVESEESRMVYGLVDFFGRAPPIDPSDPRAAGTHSLANIHGAYSPTLQSSSCWMDS